MRKQDMAAPVATFLEELGTSADQIAFTLRKMRILGVRNTVRFLNPVVRAIQVEFKDETSFMDVAGGVLHITRIDGAQESLPLSAALLEFLAAFNGGAYLDLEFEDTFP